MQWLGDERVPLRSLVSRGRTPTLSTEISRRGGGRGSSVREGSLRMVVPTAVEAYLARLRSPADSQFLSELPGEALGVVLTMPRVLRGLFWR